MDTVQAVDYYRTERGGHENSVNRYRITSVAEAMGFDAFHFAEKLLNQPF